MADSKVSSLVPATVLGAGDYLLLVQGGNSIKLDIQTLFGKIPVRPVVLEASETILSGVLATNLLTSKIRAITAGVAYTLAAGTHGMEKVIVCSVADVTTPSAVLTVSSPAGYSTITFNAVGDSVHLKNIDGLWYVVGTNSVVLA